MKICIIGGGTTGWWAAGYIEHNFPEYDITLIESSDIPIVGVGESTLPMIKTFFESFGMKEETWMPKCDAIHKHGNIKQGWDKPDGEEFKLTQFIGTSIILIGVYLVTKKKAPLNGASN